VADEVERCEGCGFVWESVPAADVPIRIADGVSALAALLAAGPPVTVRPSPGRWSVLEYAAHVRDVLLHVRDRLVFALVEDNPSFKPLYRDERVELGLYHNDVPDAVAAELALAGGLYGRAFRAATPEQLARPCQYAYPTPRTRSVLWMSQQVVHEVEHHLGDARENLRALDSGP
jgi:DinB superfamily